MTLIDAITALVLLGVFLFGFSQIFFPAYNAWQLASTEYYTAHSMQFIAGSFRKECAKPSPDIENWEKIISAARGLEDCEISELWQKEKLLAYRVRCVIAGESLEIIGLCAP